MEQPKLVCPICETAYAAGRCGIALDGTAQEAVVKCVLCQHSFTVKITPVDAVRRGAFAQRVLRRDAVETPATHTITSTLRR